VIAESLTRHWVVLDGELVLLALTGARLSDAPLLPSAIAEHLATARGPVVLRTALAAFCASKTTVVGRTRRGDTVAVVSDGVNDA
jgi:hypothetical protein